MHGVRKVRRVDAQCLAVLIDRRDDVRTMVQRCGTAADPAEQFEHPKRRAASPTHEAPESTMRTHGGDGAVHGVAAEPRSSGNG
jgi:hypothetical protein